MDYVLDLDVRSLLELFAQEGHGPAAGSAAALVTASAAALVGRAARTSGSGWAGADGAVAQAAALRSRVSPLALEDAEAYASAVQGLSGAGGASQEQRDFALGRSLSAVADVLLRIADAAADVTELAALVTEQGGASKRADAVGAAILAEASARTATHLVEVNLAVNPADERGRSCREARATAAAALQRALAAG